MADAAAADEKASVAAPAPAFPIKLLIIVSVVALLFGLGGAVVAVKFLGGSDKGADTSDEHKTDAPAKSESHGGGKQGQAAAPGAMFDLDPFIVNLADTPDVRYLKITIKLEVENEAVSTDLSARVPQVRDAVLVLLSSKDVNAVRTTQGKFQLRDEITQRINGLLPKPGVRSAYFTDFVVQ